MHKKPTYFFHRNSEDLIKCLLEALKAKDRYTYNHSFRVAELSYNMAFNHGLRGKELEAIHIAACLHDIGKIGVPDCVLNKPSSLLDAEWSHIHSHPVVGANILSFSSELGDIAKIVLHHHERFDGCGYPSNLSKSEIPLGARIIALSDAVDTMTSDRPYRKALSMDICLSEVVRNSGSQFDPEVVSTFLSSVEDSLPHSNKLKPFRFNPSFA